MTRSGNTVWIAGTGVLAVLTLVATYFLLLAPKRAEAADIATQTAQVALQNEAIAQKTQLLQSQFATLDQSRAELAAIRATLPAEADVQALLRQVEGYAIADGLVLTSVETGTPALHGADASGTAPVTAEGTTVVDVPLTVSVEGSFAATELFVKQVQADMGRFLLLKTVDLTAGTTAGDEGVTTKLTGTVFVVRDSTTTDTSGAAAPTTGSEG